VAMQTDLTMRYIEAVGEGRLDDVRELLHPDVTFEGAGSNVLQGADAYVAALERLSPIIARNEILRVFGDGDGDETCVIYDFVTDTPVGPVRSIEWLTFEDGRIAAIRLLFDKARWPEVLEHLAQVGAAA
jgi:ketosteroid isomerase-like protein